MHKPFTRFSLSIIFAATIALGSSSVNAARLALVMANEQYQTLSSAKLAAADADAVGAAMRQAGFVVTLLKNRNAQQMRADFRQFRLSVKGGDEIFVYFGGHGVQIADMNYLLPVDILAESEAQVVDEAMPLSKILGDLREQQAGLIFAVIDAARENPFKTAGRAIGRRGLAPVSGHSGQIVLYSAGDGQSSLDRLGADDSHRNSIFARVFVDVAGQPGLTVDQVARGVREQVSRQAAKAKHTQVPAVYDQVLGKFYLKAPVPGQATASINPSSVPATGTSLSQESEFWDSVKNSNNTNELDAYLQRYPSGQFGELARERIRRIREALATPSAPESGDARPGLPYSLSPEIWAMIEQSQAFKSSVPVKPTLVKFHQELKGGGQTYTSSIVRKIAPLPGSPAAYSRQTEFQQPITPLYAATTLLNYNALYFLPLGQTANGHVIQKLTRLNEITGSLFPMKLGNQLVLDFEFDRPPFDKTMHTRIRMDCRVKENVAASTFRADLLGAAWIIECAHSQTFARKTYDFPKKHIYFESGNLMDFAISPMESPTGSVTIPKADTFSLTFGASTFNYSAYQLQIGP